MNTESMLLDESYRSPLIRSYCEAANATLQLSSLLAKLNSIDLEYFLLLHGTEQLSVLLALNQRLINKSEKAARLLLEYDLVYEEHDAESDVPTTVDCLEKSRMLLDDEVSAVLNLGKMLSQQ